MFCLLELISRIWFVALLFIVISSIVLVGPWSALIDQPLIFCFPNCFILFWLFTFLASVYYLICDQVTYRTFHFPILDDFVRQVLVNSVLPTIFMIFLSGNICRIAYFKTLFFYGICYRKHIMKKLLILL